MSTTQRFDGILDPELMQQQSVVIVGVGAVGNNLARIIGAMNPGELTLIDNDTVEIENVGPQMYCECSIGKNKVDACSEDIPYNGALHCLPYKAPSPKTDAALRDATCVFMCVDSMEARGKIIDCIGELPDCKDGIVIDTRMGAETYQIWDARSLAWAQNMFTDAESLPEACNARSTPWCATMCASHAAFYWSQWLRKEEMPSQIIHDLRTNEVVPVG